MCVVPLNTGDSCSAVSGCADQGCGKPSLSALCSKTAIWSGGQGRTATQPDSHDKENLT